MAVAVDAPIYENISQSKKTSESFRVLETGYPVAVLSLLLFAFTGA